MTSHNLTQFIFFNILILEGVCGMCGNEGSETATIELLKHRKRVSF